MKIIIYDFEVFCKDWLVVFSDTEGKDIKVVVNDTVELRKIMLQEDVIFAGFNNRNYDDYIAQTILTGATNDIVKECNDWIIGGNQGFEFPFIAHQAKLFKSFDLRSDIPDMHLSLKAIEGNICEPIIESSIPFDIPRKLTKAEIDETIFYCKHDVANTVKLYHLRKDYLEAKLAVGRLKGWDEAKSLPPTNPKLAAMFLDAQLQDYDDEFCYEPPEGLKLGKYSQLLDFYKDIDYTKKLDLVVAGIPHTFGWGGLHGSVEYYQDKSTDEWKIVDIDVGSMYPTIMLNWQAISRSIPSAEGYAEIYHRRLDAKHNGRKEEANALKLVLNSTYGAMKNGLRDVGADGKRTGKLLFGNPLYDPHNANRVCITGQLWLTSLISMLESVKSFKLIQSNTDGLMIKYHIKDEPKIQKIVREWQKVSLMSMEWKLIKSIAAMKDVNNYILVEGETWLVNEDGSKTVTDKDKNKITTKGAWVSLWNGGSYKNNSLVIVHKALVEYFVNGIPPEETINNATNIFDFQMICKRGSTYQKTVWMVDDKEVEVQKVNRVYATSNNRYGTLYKTKPDRKDKIADVPIHCIVDNENKLTINDIDKTFYINLAKKRIMDYLGEKESKETKTRKKVTKMAAQKLTLLQKLTKARLEFLKKNPKKTGVNRYTEYEYFELKDIVPVATEIFNEVGLFFQCTFMNGTAYGRMFDAEGSVEDTPVEFMFDMAKIDTISNAGKSKMNAMQGVGAEITYARRYLYMLALDVVEADMIDRNADLRESNSKAETKPKAENTEAVIVKANHAPATPEERKEAVKEMTGGDMTEPQKKAIVNAMKKLRSNKPSEETESFIASITSKIKDHKAGKVVISSTEAEDILISIGEKLKVNAE